MLPRPPITQLRPLHTWQQNLDYKLETPQPGGQDRGRHDFQLLHWSSSLEPKPGQDTAIKAFAELVVRIVVLDPGEACCIQDTKRGGFLLVNPASGDQGSQSTLSFVESPGLYDIPTDFSIGGSKVRSSSPTGGVAEEEESQKPPLPGAN